MYFCTLVCHTCLCHTYSLSHYTALPCTDTALNATQSNLQRDLTKEHYEELVAAVRLKHEDAGDRRFGALVSSEMKMLKMFTVADPTTDALAFLRDHEYVSDYISVCLSVSQSV